MSQIDRAMRRRLERREKRRSVRLEPGSDPNSTSSVREGEITGHGWAVHKHGPSIQWTKADVSADLDTE